MNPALPLGSGLCTQCVCTYHHLLKLITDAHARHLLEVLQTCQNLVLNLELCLHTERGALLDGERLCVESFEGTG
jgi:hypothetical protein